MKTIFHPSENRGKADYGWLKTHYSFSFSHYYHPEKMNFGALRVINDDEVAGGMGFSKHPHQNMEIISIPLEGGLKHEDSMGNSGIIQKGEIQVMSAGSGVMHSEKNASLHEPVKLLQIWVLPNQNNVTPRYDQQSIQNIKSNNGLQQILSPNPEDDGVWIHQDAWFHLGNFAKGTKEKYTLKKQNNGVYLFLIHGKLKVENQTLSPRDAMGLWETNECTIEALTDSEFLIIEVPMVIPNFA
ncbi:MAG: pirin family protein [Bacteroidetes bacterium]|nr:pirin family protein [Bacteroidota bacterium]